MLFGTHNLLRLQTEHFPKLLHAFMQQNFRQPPVLDNTVWCLGCSHVYGVGVDESVSICSILAKLINAPVDNLGIPGASTEMVIAIYLYLIARHRPRGVVILWPHWPRKMVVLPERILRLGMWTFENPNYACDEYADILAGFKQELVNGQLQKATWNTIRGFEGMHAETKNFHATTYQKAIEAGNHTRLQKTPQGFLDLGDDNEHSGPISHAAAARGLAEVIKTHWHIS